MLFGHIPGSNMHLVFANMSIKCTYKIQILQYVDYVNCYIYILFLVLFIITEQMVYRVFASA